MRANIRFELACVALSLFAVLPVAQAKTLSRDSGKPASPAGLSDLPAQMQPGISATLGREDSHYLATPIDGGFHLSNPRQHLSADFTAAGASIAENAASWQMKLSAYGYGDKLGKASAATIDAKDNRVAYHRGSMTEWYVNGPIGVEQGFTLDSRPGVSKGAPLTLQIALAGNVTPSVDAASNALTLASNDAPALHYSGLTAYDAAGTAMKSWMELRGTSLLLHVDDRNAQYPLTVDPYVRTVTLSTEDAQKGDEFGYSVAFNDAYAVVGTPYHNNVTGTVYVFAAPTSETTDYTAKLTASNGLEGDGFGASVAISPGNIILVGAPFVNAFSGAAYTFAEPPGGFVTTSAFTSELTAYDGTPGDFLGLSVAITSNTVVLGAPGYGTPTSGGVTGDSTFTGSVCVYASPASISTPYYNVREVDPAGAEGDGLGWKVNAYNYNNVTGTPYPNNFTGAAYFFGGVDSTYLAKFTASDGAEGDGFGVDATVDGTASEASVVAVGAPFRVNQQGGVYIYTKPATEWTSTNVAQALITESDPSPVDYFGYSVSLKDGVLGVGAIGVSNFTGQVDIYNQPAGGWASTTTADAVLNPPSTDETTEEYFGYSTSVAPSGAVLISAPYINEDGEYTAAPPGLAYVFTPTSAPAVAKKAIKKKKK